MGEGGCACVGAGKTLESSIAFALFYCESKIALKNKVYFLEKQFSVIHLLIPNKYSLFSLVMHSPSSLLFLEEKT